MQGLSHSELIKQVMSINALIKKHIGNTRATRLSERVPRWYRGLSGNQANAARDLSEALRDDMEQMTHYRVMRTLTCLGLHPMPSRDMVKQVMRMSRGNDVAFLYFLMELCYKPSDLDRNAYDNNAQILLTAIFRIDLGPTLQELDRILPLPHASAEDRAKAAKLASQRERKLAAKQKASQQCVAQAKPKRKLYPYFEEPIMPKSKPLRLNAKYPKRPAIFMKYHNNSNQFTVRNRWFGSYPVSESKRVAKGLLYEELHGIVKSFAKAKLHSADVQAVCQTHKQIQELEESLHRNLTAIKAMEMQKLLDITWPAKERRRKRIRKELEELTSCFESLFHEMALKARRSSMHKELLRLSKRTDGAEDYCPPEFLYLGFPVGGDGDACRVSEGKEVEKSENEPRVCCDNSAACRDRAYGDGDDRIKIQLIEGQRKMARTCTDAYFGSTKKFTPKQVGSTQLKLGIDKGKTSVAEFLEQGHKSQQLLDEKYFELGPTAHEYKFNYRKLFDEDQKKRLNDEQLHLKMAFVEALDNDVELLSKSLEQERNVSLDELVAQAAKKIFKEDTEMFNTEYKRLQRREKRKHLQQPDRLDFGLKYYDCNNLPQMREMLRIGLQRVSENKYFVMASLPNVETIPYLMEWICHRYGKRYSQSERKRIFEETRSLMTHLAILLKGPVVRVPDVTRFKTLSFDKQKCLRRLAKRFGDRYSGLFFQSLMEVGRVFYFAMRTQLCNRLFTDTFFAYMPSFYRDIIFSTT